MTDPRNIIVWVLVGLLTMVSVIAGHQILARQAEEVAHARTKQRHAEQLQGLAQLAIAAADKARVARDALQGAFASIDQATTKGKRHALTDNDRRRAADAAGTERLRIAAVCPATAAGGEHVPGGPTGPGVDAGTAELAPEVRQAVWDLRAEVIKLEAQLLHLQLREEARQRGGAPP